RDSWDSSSGKWTSTLCTTRASCISTSKVQWSGAARQRSWRAHRGSRSMGTTRHRSANLGRAWTGGLLVAALSHLPVTHAAAADSERIAVLEQKLDQSLQTIQELSARVHDLEVQVAQGAPATVNKPPGRTAAAAAAAAPAATTPSDTAQRLTKVEQTLTQMAASAGQHAEGSGLPLHGFADV